MKVPGVQEKEYIIHTRIFRLCRATTCKIVCRISRWRRTWSATPSTSGRCCSPGSTRPSDTQVCECLHMTAKLVTRHLAPELQVPTCPRTTWSSRSTGPGCTWWTTRSRSCWNFRSPRSQTFLAKSKCNSGQQGGRGKSRMCRASSGSSKSPHTNYSNYDYNRYEWNPLYWWSTLQLLLVSFIALLEDLAKVLHVQRLAPPQCTYVKITY